MVKRLFLLVLFVQIGSVVSLAAQNTTSPQDIPTIEFCELVKNPQRYYEKAIRVTARWDSGYEFSYLNDDRCPTKARTDIAVAFVDDESQREIIKQNVHKIMSHEYGGHAIIKAVGILHKPPQRYYGYYRYRFEILRFEDIAHIVIPYQGTLQAGTTYRATVRGDKDSGLSLVPPLRILEHYAVAIDWTNLKDFPELEKLQESRSEQRIVFSVISDKIVQMTERRWNRTIECKIVRIE